MKSPREFESGIGADDYGVSSFQVSSENSIYPFASENPIRIIDLGAYERDVEPLTEQPQQQQPSPVIPIVPVVPVVTAPTLENSNDLATLAVLGGLGILIILVLKR